MLFAIVQVAMKLNDSGLFDTWKAHALKKIRLSDKNLSWLFTAGFGQTAQPPEKSSSYKISTKNCIFQLKYG